MVDADDAFLKPSGRHFWPHTVAADVPVMFYMLGAAVALALPGDTTSLLPSFRLLGKLANEPVLILIYSLLGLAVTFTTCFGLKEAALAAFGATALWLLFAGLLQLWSVPQGPGWAANLALAMLAVISWFRRMAAGWVRHDLRRSRSA